MHKFDPDNLLAEEDGIRFEPHQMPTKWKGETRKEKHSKQGGVVCEIVILNNPLFSPFFTGAFIEKGWSETWGLTKKKKKQFHFFVCVRGRELNDSIVYFKILGPLIHKMA